MLTVQALGAQGPGYFLSLTTSSGRSVSYYTDESSEPKGYWYGPGAAELGVTGEVGQELEKLCLGFDPETGKKLVRNAGILEGPKKRTLGFDLCMSCPKSVSVLWALAGDELRDE